MEIRNSLRKLLRKLGGDPRPDDSAASLVSKIADNVDGSGGGSGAGGMVINAVGPDNMATYTLDKTFGEIYAAITSGIIPVVHFPAIGEGIDPFYSPIVEMTWYEGQWYFKVPFINSRHDPEYAIFGATGDFADEYPTGS